VPSLLFLYHALMKTIIVCTNFRPFTTQPSCAQRGSEELADWLEQEISARGLAVKVERSVCLGHCPIGPNVRLLGKDFYHESTKEKLIPLLESLEVPN
jgi:NADH:ubiquinone oxidoreductase subunit E